MKKNGCCILLNEENRSFLDRLFLFIKQNEEFIQKDFDKSISEKEPLFKKIREIKKKTVWCGF